jgi:ribokinase
VTGGFDVVVVGSVNRDYVCRVDVLPRPGETVLGGEASVGSGGKGGNQAVAASLLGARTALVGCVGRDDDGRALTEDLARASVDTRQLVASDDRTGMAFVLVDARGENSIVVAPGANLLLDEGHTVHALRSMLAPSGVVVTQAEIPARAFDAAVRAGAAMGCRVVANLAPYRPVDEAVLELCDPLVVNETEAGELLGGEVRGEAQARAAAATLKHRCRSAIVTIGRGGAVVAGDFGLEVVPADPADAVDTTGAGDAFVGALAAALSAGRGLVEATQIGVRAGTYAVTGAGAQASFASAADLGLGPLHRRG